MSTKNKEMDNCDFVAATPISVSKGKVRIGESTIVPSEKDLIVLKKNKRGRK